MTNIMSDEICAIRTLFINQLDGMVANDHRKYILLGSMSSNFTSILSSTLPTQHKVANLQAALWLVSL